MSVSYNARVFFGVQIESIDYDNEPTNGDNTFGYVEVGSGGYGGEVAFFVIASKSYATVGDYTKIFISLENQIAFRDSDEYNKFIWGYMKWCNDNNLVPINEAKPQWYMGFNIS